ncbi:MAG: hypothetical protein IJ741_01010, partial [Schwartzia sp.]|nr:hypothetical protein [Schwartzia sp. (in: firmicutes)]
CKDDSDGNLPYADKRRNFQSFRLEAGRTAEYAPQTKEGINPACRETAQTEHTAPGGVGCTVATVDRLRVKLGFLKFQKR